MPVGRLVTYAQGRSNGCTSWTRRDAQRIVALVRDDPTTLYIYPETADILGVRRATETGQRPPYWNASCLAEIGAPRFWSEARLTPAIAAYARDHPRGPYRPLPVCKRR